MKFVPSTKMKEIDRLATEKFAIPSLILMENAGRSVADQVQKLHKNKSGRIIIFCGYGNNGGDGFVSARHLINRGYSVDIYLVGRQKKMGHDSKINFGILNKMDVRFKRITQERQIESVTKRIKNTRLIVDAIFGIGIKGMLDKFYSTLFKELNSTDIPILSIDVPSGLDADSGMALPIAIKAEMTVTMGLPKRGFLNPLARKYLGKVVIADISLPKQLK